MSLHFTADLWLWVVSFHCAINQHSVSFECISAQHAVFAHCSYLSTVSLNFLLLSKWCKCIFEDLFLGGLGDLLSLQAGFRNRAARQGRRAPRVPFSQGHRSCDLVVSIYCIIDYKCIVFYFDFIVKRHCNTSVGRSRKNQ